MHLTLIENGEVYTPEPVGKTSVLLAGGKIFKLGAIERRALDRLGVDYDVIDARNGLVTPGLIDPHEHLLGGSGEEGFWTQTPSIELSELLRGGITTVVGCLGVDTTMKTLPGLLARVKALREEGLSAYLWTGGYNVPPTTLMGSVRNDLLFVAEVIGAGEIAIADERSTDPQAQELARLVNDAYVGGMLSRKAGVTHFHVGERASRLRLLRTLLDEYTVEPAWLYPTHVQRNEALLEEALDLVRRGATADFDTVENDLPRWLRRWLEQDGPMDRLTISSDASLTRPSHVYEQLTACVRAHGFRLEQVLPLATTNPAQVLKLEHKGRLAEGKDSDLLVLERGSLELVEVIAGGRRLWRAGQPAVAEHYLQKSDRSLHLEGKKSRSAAD